MAWNGLKRELSELFTPPKTRAARREYRFHLKVAEGLEHDAFSDLEGIWDDYWAELTKAIPADREGAGIEARWHRSRAAAHWMKTFRRGAADSRIRDIASTWRRDLSTLLKEWPSRDPDGMTVAGVREMEVEFERLCRGLKLH